MKNSEGCHALGMAGYIVCRLAKSLKKVCDPCAAEDYELHITNTIDHIADVYCAVHKYDYNDCKCKERFKSLCDMHRCKMRDPHTVEAKVEIHNHSNYYNVHYSADIPEAEVLQPQQLWSTSSFLAIAKGTPPTDFRILNSLLRDWEGLQRASLGVINHLDWFLSTLWKMVAAVEVRCCLQVFVL